MEESQKNNFEFNVLAVACVIGLFRSIIEVVRDLMAVELLPNFYLDLTFILVFSTTLVALKKGVSAKIILFIFYVPFIILITIMFIDARGLAYSIENNVFASLIIITFTSREKMPFYLNGSLFVAIMGSLIVIEYQYHLLENFVSQSAGKFNFLFSSVGVIAFTLYAKSEFEKSQRKITTANQLLDKSNKSLQAKNEELLAKKEALEKLALNLDKKIKSDSQKLKTQQRRVEKYLSITMTELFDAYHNTIDSVEAFNGKMDNIASMVVKSGENLKTEMEALRGKIEESINDLD